ncbi:MAG TPA: DUF2336 domain-containing protein [Xanthobacteraceae bacterium]|nr:DUF2336 domain-containing protein [Xanthobacteraceae bacterium]
MNTTASLIPELEDVIQSGSPERCTRTLKRITNLFIEGAEKYNEEQVSLFDDVLCQLVTEIESKARAELAQRLAPISNAPVELVRHLAHDNDIAVAGPVLQQSPRLNERDLVGIAETKSQAHLHAIATRQGLGEAVTDVLVRRGDQEVARSVAGNVTARLSNEAFSALVSRAEKDSVLAENVGRRPDIPPYHFRQLLMRATEVVQRRLLANAAPETQAEIRRVLANIAQEMNQAVEPDFAPAQRTVLSLHKAGTLGEAQLLEFAEAKKVEETVATLSALCGVPIETVDRLTAGERPDPVLILCKAVGFGWPTARAIILARAGDRRISEDMLEAALANYERLSATTARRVLRFWQVRQVEEEMR